MQAACPSCRALFEIDPALAAGPGVPLCEACSKAGEAPPPPARRSRPKMPVVEIGRRRGGQQAPAEEAPRAPQPSDPLSFEGLDTPKDDDGGSAPMPSRASSSRPPSEPVLDGGFVRTGRPISVLPGDPGPSTRRSSEPSLSELASDIEAVNLGDLGVVLGPASAPPPWASAPSGKLDEVATGLKPRATRRPPAAQQTSPEEEAPPARARDTAKVVEAQVARARATPRAVEIAPAKPEPPPREEEPKPADPDAVVDSARLDLQTLAAASAASQDRPSFFRVDSIHPPAPDIPITDEADEPAVSSGRVDLNALLSGSSSRAPKSDAMLFNLKSGLFAEASPPAAPVEPLPPSSPIAPVLRVDRVPQSVRPPPRPASAAVQATEEAPPRTVRSVAPRAIAAKPAPAAPRGGLAAWIVGGVAAATVAGLVASRLGGGPAPQPEARLAITTATAPSATTAAPPPTPPATVTAPATVAAPAQEAPSATASATARPRETATPTAAPRETAAPHETAAPRAADTAQASKVAVAPRVTAAPAKPPETAAPAKPPPAAGGGGEFDKAAAKAALSAGAAAAAGCKQPDDPAGGARVSVTFAPSGRATTVRLVGGSFAGTPTGGCIIRAFRGISVPPFSGDPVTVGQNVNVR